VVSWRFESDTVINLAINIVIVSFFAFFEGMGWRGYMLPKMESGYPRLAAALVGFLHGLWQSLLTRRLPRTRLGRPACSSFSR
jgi:membrane protease YdiL (CAAX protease family)